MLDFSAAFQENKCDHSIDGMCNVKGSLLSQLNAFNHKELFAKKRKHITKEKRDIQKFFFPSKINKSVVTKRESAADAVLPGGLARREPAMLA